MRNIKLICCTFIIINFFSCNNASDNTLNQNFVSVHGKYIVDSKGNNIILRGTNLGNWLHPEGYMFKFKKTNSAYKIEEVINQLIGPDEAKKFWNTYLENYVTQEDIAYLKKIGSNHLRLPFNYKMLTDQYYLGSNMRGFQYIDSVIEWCRKEKLWVLLDMHAAPGGQTGDNIDDSFGYPFLFINEQSKLVTIELWRQIAERYKNDTVVIGYDLLNEPIAHYYEADYEILNPELEPLYKRIVAEIRKVDQNHLIFLGGAQWNTNFKIFGEPFDDKLVYTFHKYWMDVEVSQIQEYLDFQEKYNVPLYLGESGENTDEWINEFRQLLEEHEISWCFWPYKKMENTRGIMNFKKPELYDIIINYAEGDRTDYKNIRENRPPIQDAIKALQQFNENSMFKNCFPNPDYIEALGFSRL